MGHFGIVRPKRWEQQEKAPDVSAIMPKIGILAVCALRVGSGELVAIRAGPWGLHRDDAGCGAQIVSHCRTMLGSAPEEESLTTANPALAKAGCETGLTYPLASCPIHL